jgi:hypothetical protein
MELNHVANHQHLGIDLTGCVQGGGLQLDPIAASAGDRMSLPGIRPRPRQRLCGSGKLG